MGNSASNFHASVGVALDRSQYHAGEEVNGYVQVNVTSEMSCTELYATFTGEVRTVVHYTETQQVSDGEGRTRSETVHRTAYGRDVIVTDRRLVAYFPSGRAAPGLYQFPFVFPLHPSLPSSCLVTGHDHAVLAYAVDVQLHRPNIFKHDLVHRAYLDLVANIPHAITPAYIQDHVRVFCCCCFGRGSINLAAALQKNAFAACESVAVNVQIENASTVEVRQLTVAMVERVRFRAQGHHHEKRCELARVNLPPVPPDGGFGEWNGTQPMLVQMNLPPHFMHCSLSTRLLEVMHMVEVTATTPFGVTNPVVRLPVTLHRSSQVTQAGVPPTLVSPEDGDLQGAVPVPYQPSVQAMVSPGAVSAAVGLPVAPSGVVPDPGQALRGLQCEVPVQQAMYPQDGDARQMRTPMVG